VNIDMIRAAAARLNGQARRTPVLSSPFLDEIAGRRVFVKAECLQHTGSFKFRGAWNAISASDAPGFVAVSSGNHAQGVALAARMQGRQAVIIMPQDAPQVKIDNTRAYGAEVVLYDRDAQDRDALMNDLAAQRGLEKIPPFDHPLVIAGQGTVGLEVAQDFKDMRGDVYVCCGGGGLTSGVALALEAAAPGLRARPVEPEGFDDVARSLSSGTRQRNTRLSGSICDAIVTPTPGELTLPILQRLCGPGLVVSDAMALRAMRLALERLRIVLEPGGAVALAAALFLPGEGDVLVVASGGNADPAMIARALAA
jgi:threonine dehydratase